MWLLLMGGYNKWVKEGRRISTETIQPISRQYVGEVRDHIFVSKRYVLERIGKSIIVDARDPEVYFGIVTEPWGPIPGHIPTAKNPPTPWIWTPEGMYRPIDVIEKMVQGVIGTDKDREIIVYCGVGGYSSVLWYVLTQILSYTNVKIYDGGWQEWLKEPQGPISVYRWE